MGTVRSSHWVTRSPPLTWPELERLRPGRCLGGTHQAGCGTTDTAPPPQQQGCTSHMGLSPDLSKQLPAFLCFFIVDLKLLTGRGGSHL